ncbi:MAG: hypothetical protein AAF630_17315 [Cyanobacteria bacterium P01_C01_bin.38]
MHEAQTPDDGVNIKNLNSVDSSVSSEGTNNPFYSILAREHKAKELLLLAPANEESLPPAVVDYSQEKEVTEHIDTTVEITIDSGLDRDPVDEEIDLESDSNSDWVAEPNVKQQGIINAEFDKLLQLNEELQNANNQLYEQAEELTAALSESEAALQRQRKRSNVAESMLKQQTQELNAAQAQIQSLFEQLEHSVQNAQRQENLAESYRGQLELNQQRLAQLERECASIQHNYSEQTRLLSQSENACRELRTRLKRQQRQTLQFKAALEKSLETSIPGYDTLDDSDSNFSDVKNSQLNKLSRTHNISSTQSIKPWSAPAESDKIQNDLWEEIPTTPTANNSQNPIPEVSSTWEFTANPDLETDEYKDNTQTNNHVNNDLDDGDRSTEEVPPSNSETEETIEQMPPLDLEDEEKTVGVVPPSESDLEEQLDSVIQTFFAQTESVSSQSPQEQNTQTSDSDEDDEDIAPTWTTIIEPRETNNHVVNVETDRNSETDSEQTITFTSSMNDSSTNETEDYWEEVSHYPAFELSQNPASFEIISDTDFHDNSPSPLIYPKRPPKGRKSLASVELPKFSQKNDGNNE